MTKEIIFMFYYRYRHDARQIQIKLSRLLYIELRFINESSKNETI